MLDNHGHSDPADDYLPTDRRCSKWGCGFVALGGEDVCLRHSEKVYNQTPEYKVAYEL